MLTLPVKQTYRPVNFTIATSKFTKSIMLTINEERFKDAIRMVNRDSVWGDAIHNVFMNYSDAAFRNMVNELLSQQHDDFDTMGRIIGEKANRLLLNLRP